MDSLPTEPQGKPKNTGVGSLSLLQGTFPPRNQIGVSYITGGFFTNWAITEAQCVDTCIHLSYCFIINSQKWNFYVKGYVFFNCRNIYLKYLCLFLITQNNTFISFFFFVCEKNKKESLQPCILPFCLSDVDNFSGFVLFGPF